MPGLRLVLLQPSPRPRYQGSTGRLRQAELLAQGQGGVRMLKGGWHLRQRTPLCALHLPRRLSRPPSSRAAVKKRRRAV